MMSSVNDEPGPDKTLQSDDEEILHSTLRREDVIFDTVSSCQDIMSS